MTFAARPHTQASPDGGGVPFSLTSVFENGADPVAVTGVITVGTDGTVKGYAGTTTLGNWYSPTTGGIGSGYRVRFQVAGDPFTGLAVNTFYALSSARSVTFSAPPNYSGSSGLTIQIATTGSDTIIASGTVAVTVTNTWE